MEKEPVSPRPLGQLPKNSKTYMLTSVGGVSYELGPTEPVWKIYFSRFKNHKQMDGEGFSIQLGGTLLRAAAVGSIWENRKNIGFLGTSWPRHIQLELPERVIDQTVVYRTDESGSINPVFIDKDTPGARPYLLLRILGEPVADFVIISCFEVFRFYYAYLRSVCRHFFSFDKAGDNLKLFNPSSTDWNEKRTCFIFDPKPNISDADQRRLAHYLASKTARGAIGLTAASARAQFAKKEPVLPVCRVPIIGLNKWNVVGGIRNIRINSGGIEAPLKVIAISRLIDCFDKGRVPAVLSLRERTIWRPKQKDKVDKERKRKKSGPPPTTDEDLPAISDKPFGNRTRVNDKDSKNTAFDRECWNGVRYNRIGEKIEVELAQIADDEDIDPDAASSSNQGGGDPKIGRLGDTPPPPSKREPIVDPISEEEYRRNLEHIFHFKAPGQITSEEIEVKDLPESLAYLFHSATQFFDGAAKPLGCFLGGDSKMFYEDVVPVFVLDPNWGRNTRCRAAKDGVRRALVLEIPTEFGFLYFFDLEKKKGEKISIHAMLFNGRSLSTDQIASILYKRLEGREHRGWPKRKQYSGEFWSASLYHYDEISPEDRGAQISSFISHVGGG